MTPTPPTPAQAEPQPTDTLNLQALIALHETAADWLLRRSEPGWTGADERALNAWLQADAQHQAAYTAAASTSQALHQLPGLQAGDWRPQPSSKPRTAPPSARPVMPPVSPRRRAWAAALASGLLAVVAGGVHWHHQQQTQYALEVHTGPTEVREIALPDGSHIVLNRHSQLQLRYTGRQRQVVLSQGEAFFQVQPDASRPFTVDHGASEVRVVGTAFNVRTGAHSLTVKVSEGRVQLRPDRDGPTLLRLDAGTGVALDTRSGRHYAVAAPLDAVGDWRQGQLHFQRTPLAEVAEELARYLERPVVLADASLGGMPVSGVAATARPTVFLQALPGVLPVQVRAQTDGSWHITRRGD